MMNSEILLSLCVPTNGVIEWVFPVLDSIYSDAKTERDFEVIVTDNGGNEKFNKMMLAYVSKHENLIYKKTEAVQFLNQVESFKLASGQMVKFINHRFLLCPGTLNYFIDYVKDNVNEKPVTYFSNGKISSLKEKNEYDSFDCFVKFLSYFSSWSAGTTMWNEDFEKLNLNRNFNELFPHTDFVFSERKKNVYIIDNTVLFEEIDVDDTKKGKYDLFHAFAVEYPGILLDLLRNGDISKETFLSVKEGNCCFLAGLYYLYIIKKNPCSYDLSSYKKSIATFYSHYQVLGKLSKLVVCKLMRKMRIINGK